MSDNKDGGPAFPTVMTATTNNPVGDGRTLQTHYGSQSGMTLRDYFAAAALPIASKGKGFTADDIAKRSYYIADAMIKYAEGKP